MSKRTRNLIILAVLAIVLIGAIVVVNNNVNKVTDGVADVVERYGQ